MVVKGKASDDRRRQWAVAASQRRLGQRDGFSRFDSPTNLGETTTTTTSHYSQLSELSSYPTLSFIQSFVAARLASAASASGLADGSSELLVKAPLQEPD